MAKGPTTSTLTKLFVATFKVTSPSSSRKVSQKPRPSLLKLLLPLPVRNPYPHR